MRGSGHRPRAMESGRGPALSGQKTAEIRQKTALTAPPPPRHGTGARAMFLANIYVKNDMNVSRETLVNFCADMRGLLTA